MIAPGRGPSSLGEVSCRSFSLAIRVLLRSALITNANSTNKMPMNTMCKKLGKFGNENANAMSTLLTKKNRRMGEVGFYNQ